MCPCGHLLGEQGGLDAVEQALQPPDELGLRDAELCLAWRIVVGERQREPFEFVGQLRGVRPECVRLYTTPSAYS